MVDSRLLDAPAASSEGYRHLATWLRHVEGAWSAHSALDSSGTPVMTMQSRLDHMRGLSLQGNSRGSRIVYAKAGTLMSAAVLEDETAVIDHMAYWATSRSVAEARYLTAVINSETVRARIEPMQPKGQGGARHFDNLVWELNIPEFASRSKLHSELAAAAAVAETVAAAVPLTEGAYFTTSRRAIRDALTAHGIAARIDALVARLLDSQ